MDHSQAVKEQLESHFRLHQEQLAIKDSEIRTLNAENIVYKEVIGNLRKENEELKNYKFLYKLIISQRDEAEQCLEEIEKIINYLIDTLPPNCDSLKEYYEKIIQKIQEVNDV